MRICDDLRQAVLQAAIQGKLTKRLPEDGNAADLLKQIAKEKNQLIKEGKIKKEKPLPEVSPEEIPFDIPENWLWVRWGSLAKSIQYGFNAPGLQSGRIKMLRISDISANNTVNWETVPFCNIAEADIESYLLHPNDILFARTGGTVGKSFLIKELPEPSVYAGYLIRTNYNSILLSPQFLKYFMESLLYWKQLRAGTTKTAQPNCNGQTLSKMMIPLPPLAEQQRIVARVEELMARIDDLEKTETELEKLKAAFPGDMKAALLQAAMQGKLTEQLPEDGDAANLINQIRAVQVKLIKDKKLNKDVLVNTIDDEPPFDIPENWAWICLKGLVCRDIRRGKSPKYGSGKSFAFAQKCNSKYDGIRLDLALSVTDAFADRFTDGDEVQDGDIVINSTGNGTLGRIGYFEDKYNPNGYKYYPDSHVTTVRCLLTNPKYIFICLKCYQEYLEGKGEGSTNQKELKPETIKRLMIPLPPLAEQKRIVEKLDKLLPLCDGLVEE